ncbi:MAG: hypothetical protein QOC64_1541 [Solirubrobacteraceae bacterium]|jgi:hypothetical protein|nr:hypothetical protein [Solirubrobacteraceae bacterium]
MLHGLLLLATAAGEAEVSKTPFYVAGGLLAVWAVVISVVGLRSPDFPRGDGAARGVMAITAVLMVAAMATSIITG